MIRRDIVYGQNPTVHLMDFHGEEDAGRPLFLYFHGGGLETGSRGEAGAFAPRLNARGINVASVEYRMYPDAKFPDYLHDGARAASFALEQIPNAGLFLGGSSAGAYITMMLCFDTSYLRGAGVNPASIRGYVHNAGQPTTHFRILKERNLDGRRLIVDAAAPLYYVGLEKEYTPMLFIAADNDMENRLEQTNLLLSTLRHFRYDESRYALSILHATHCSYVSPKPHPDPRFADLIARFIASCGELSLI